MSRNMEDREWILIETGTTGLGNPSFPVEIAAQRMCGWTVTGVPFHRLFNQNVDISPAVSRVNGYTREILERDGDPPMDVYRDFESYVGALPLCSYYLHYDLDEVLIPDWSRMGMKQIGSRGICVLELAQRLLDPSPAGDFKLQTLRQFYRLPERDVHNALGDVLTVIDLFEQVLLPIAGHKGLVNWDAVCRFLEDPWYPRRIRLGKFKGVDFMEAVEKPELRSWLEWLAQSTNERSAAMGKWYLEQLAFASDRQEEAPILVAAPTTTESQCMQPTENPLVVYSHPDLGVLKRAIAVVREHLAEVEARYTRERNSVNVVQAQLFGLLRTHYQKRDRLKNTVFYRRAFLDAILRGDDESAKARAEESTKANEDIDAEYDHASKLAETKRALTKSEENELKKLYRKLVLLFHPDRFANDPEKSASYLQLTTAINLAKDNGDIETLREISNDPEAFMRRNKFGYLDFSDEIQVGKLRKLLTSLEAELLRMLEDLNTLLESAEYELYKLSQLDPKVVQEAAKQYVVAIEVEIKQLTKEALQLEQEIVELTGESSGVD